VITKELERAGIPTVQVCNMTPVAQSVGVNRMWTSSSIKYPLGIPEMTPGEEKEERVRMLEDIVTMLQ